MLSMAFRAVGGPASDLPSISPRITAAFLRSMLDSEGQECLGSAAYKYSKLLAGLVQVNQVLSS